MEYRIFDIMKQIKNIWYIIKFIAVLAALLFISTAIVQLGMIAAARGMGIALKEELLYDISGSLDTAITGGYYFKGYFLSGFGCAHI